jgi:hypothetical protein
MDGCTVNPDGTVRMIDTRLASKQVAAFGVAVVMMLVGVVLVVFVSFGPAYEATAVFTVGVDDPAFDGLHPEDRPRPDLEEERMIFGVRVANLAAFLAADLDTGEFTWYGPDRVEATVPIDADMILRGARIETDADNNQIIVHLLADDPTVARVGANLLVEAYRQVRPQIQFRPSCMGPQRSATPCPLEPIVVESVTFAPAPSRVDVPDGADVLLFVAVSLLAVYLTWTWWPDPQRQMERSDHSGPVT